MSAQFLDLCHFNTDYEGAVFPWGTLLLSDSKGQQITFWSRKAIPFGNGKYYATLNQLFPKHVVFIATDSIYDQTYIERTGFLPVVEQTVVNADEHGLLHPVGSFWHTDHKKLRASAFECIRNIAQAAFYPKRLIRIDPKLKHDYLILVRFQKPESGRENALFTISGEEIEPLPAEPSYKADLIYESHARLLSRLSEERISDCDMQS